MIEEPPVLGRDHRMDQIWRQFVERDLVVVPDAAPPCLLAIAVEKGHREIGFLQPILGGFLKGRTGERERQHAEANCEGERFAGEFVENASPAGKMESVHERCKGGIIFARAFQASMERGIDKRIDGEQSPRDFPAKTRRSWPIKQGVLLHRMPGRTLRTLRRKRRFGNPVDVRQSHVSSLAAYRTPGTKFMPPPPPPVTPATPGSKARHYKSCGHVCAKSGITPVPFWKQKTLEELNSAEWESLCDGCGRCCLVKLENEESGKIYFTDIACKLLNSSTCRCADYAHRRRKVHDCIKLTPAKVRTLRLASAILRIPAGCRGARPCLVASARFRIANERA